MIDSSTAGRILDSLDALEKTSGVTVLVRDTGNYECVDEIAGDAAKLIREMQEHGDPELREAHEEIRELRAELAQRTAASAA